MLPVFILLCVDKLLINNYYLNTNENLVRYSKVLADCYNKTSDEKFKVLELYYKKYFSGFLFENDLLLWFKITINFLRCFTIGNVFLILCIPTILCFTIGRRYYK